MAAGRALLVGSVLAGTVLAGCASSSPVGLPTAQDRPGICKRIGTGDEMVTSSDVSPAVSCSGPHVYETYAVGRVPAAIGRLPERPGPEIVQAQTANSCPLAPVRPYLGAGELDSQWGIEIWTKVPTRAEWRGHERALVCDLVVSAEQPNTIPLVGFPLHDVMRYTDSARVRQCRVAPDAQGFVTCDLPHTGEKMGSAGFAPALRGRQLTAAATRFCRQRIVDYTGRRSRPGFEASWTSTGGSQGDCWLTSTHGPVTGTERGRLVKR